MNEVAIKKLLEQKTAEFNRPFFIESDPVSIPHRFSRLQDIEIAGLFAALFAWGNRKSIINSCLRLLQHMDNAPHAFIQGHTDAELKKLISFAHRTFNATDLYWMIHFLKWHYERNESLESAFTRCMPAGATDVEAALAGFHDYVFSLPGAPERTRKHIATPVKNSACKRLNMYLRWMVRDDGGTIEQPVDFGLWKQIKPSMLICPLDVHVGNVARRLGLLLRPQNDWKAAMELTVSLRRFDKQDPVKYDFALFGLGVLERF